MLGSIHLPPAIASQTLTNAPSALVWAWETDKSGNTLALVDVIAYRFPCRRHRGQPVGRKMATAYERYNLWVFLWWNATFLPLGNTDTRSVRFHLFLWDVRARAGAETVARAPVDDAAAEVRWQTSFCCLSFIYAIILSFISVFLTRSAWNPLVAVRGHVSGSFKQSWRGVSVAQVLCVSNFWRLNVVV